MGNKERGFSGVGNMSTSQESLISPQALAQIPTWNPAKHSASEAKKAHWGQIKNQVEIDNYIQLQDSSVDKKIALLEQQFVQRVNAGERLQTDSDLFPSGHKSHALSSNNKTNTPYTGPARVDPLEKVNAINWSAWAAGICLVLIGIGSLSIWLFSGRPDVGSMVSKITNNVKQSVLDEQSNQEQAESLQDDATQQAGDNAAEQMLSMLEDETATDTTSSTDAAADAANLLMDLEEDTDATALADNSSTEVVDAASAAVDLFEGGESEESIYLEPILPFTPENILVSKLPVMPRIKKPDLDKANPEQLAPAEYRWCALVRVGISEIDKSPAVCSSQNLLQYGQELQEFMPYLQLLLWYRTLVEQQNSNNAYQDMDPAEAAQWLQYKLTSEANAPVLNERDTHHCGLSWMLLSSYYSLAPYGLNLSVINRQIDHFNTLCSKKSVLVSLQSQWDSRKDFIAFVRAMMLVEFKNLTADWSKFSYLSPNQGTDSQRRKEIIEAQKKLKQLGYAVKNATGYLDKATKDAIRAFEADMALKETGELTFSTLQRLRLSTQGYDSTKAWTKPLKK